MISLMENLRFKNGKKFVNPWAKFIMQVNMKLGVTSQQLMRTLGLNIIVMYFAKVYHTLRLEKR